MSAADIAILIDMGFSSSRAEKALEITGNKGVEPAMEWLLAHCDEAEPVPEIISNIAATPEETPADTPSQNDVASTSNEVSTTEADVKSLKCDVCGKLFKSELDVNYHASKTGHDKFSESTEERKGLSEDEKEQQRKLVEEKIKKKRKEREEREKVEALEKEKLRIRSGKEMAEAKKKLEELEMKKIIDQRKREKEEEKQARMKVMAQIESDKAARRAKAQGQPIPESPAPCPVTSPTASAPQQRKDYNSTRIQMRLPNGTSLTQNFGCKEQLSAVRLFVEMNRSDGNGQFTLMTTFPKKVFTEDDYDTPLDALGLVPSAVVIVQNRKD